MAKPKKITKKRAAPKKKTAPEKSSVTKLKVTAKKKSAPEKKPVSKKKNISVPEAAKKKKATSRSMAEPPANLAGLVTPAALVTVPTVNIPAGQLVIELCAPNKRCKQRADGSFIRQNFISGRWVQIGGTRFPSLEACRKACTG